MSDLDEDTRKDAAISAINEFCADELDYAENHKDAGDAYAHMPAEGDTQDMARRLVEFCKDNAIATGALEPDELVDVALENFRMMRGTIYGIRDNRPDAEFFTLDAYAVQEIEIELDGLGLDYETIMSVERDCEPYIAGTGRAYMTTDAVWYAAMHRDALAAAVSDAIAINA